MNYELGLKMGLKHTSSMDFLLHLLTCLGGIIVCTRFIISDDIISPVRASVHACVLKMSI